MITNPFPNNMKIQIPHFPLLPTILTTLVGAAVITGLFLSGSPAQERLKQFDQERLSRLQQIQNVVIETYVAQFGKLPTTLEEAMKRSPASPDVYVDPETNAFYSYEALTADTYQLCAEFSLPSDKQADAVSLMWTHGAGYSCFTLQIPLKTKGLSPSFDQMK